MTYPVAVVGASMVGSALACALGLRGIRVALIEALPSSAESEWANFDVRVSAVTRASQRIFETLGAWAGMASRRVSPYREMHVWDAVGRGSIHFDSADIGEPNLGHIIENRVMVAALEQRLAGLQAVDWFRPASILGLERNPDRVLLSLDGATVEANLVVGADGARSRVRELSGLTVTGSDYGQEALVATVKTERWHRETAWQRFLPGGPLAFLPMLDGYSSIVWSAPSERVHELLAMDTDDFAVVLADAFERRLGAVSWVGPRAAFPLRRQHAEHYVGPRVALVGDAAHTIHPLAGQGANLGFLDAAALAEVLSEAITAGKEPGEFRVLRRYERWRKGHNLMTEMLMDGFKQLFGTDSPPVSRVRSLGMNLTDMAGPVKRSLIRLAMGLQGDLPTMAR